MTKPRNNSTLRKHAGKRVRPVAIASVMLLALAAGFWWKYPSMAPPDGPILIISIDTLRADRLPAYGYHETKTPHIDSFIGDSVLFEQAYSHSPQTLPAHTSILSGLLPFEHGVRDNIGFSVRKDQRFLQHALKESGFATGGFVSAYVLRHQTGIGQGFDRYDDELPAASPELPLGQVQRPGASTVAAAVRWMEQLASPKFFAFVHIYEPHRPYSPPPRFAAGNPYDGEVDYSDEIVGQLLEFLHRSKLYDRATIVLLSDHGEGLGDHGEDEHGMFLYRETTRIPLIVKLPGSRSGKRRVATPVQQIDLVPTILDLIGAAVPRDLHGRVLRPVLEGTGPIPRTGIYSESLSPRYHFGWSELYALTDDRYRYIRAPRDELYEMASDPGERKSVTAERPQIRDAMRAALQQLIANAKVDAPSAVSETDRQRLAALGYVGTLSSAVPGTDGDKLADPKDRIAVLQKYKKATDLAGARQFTEAAVLLRELLREDPEMTDVWVQLGGFYERLGRLPDAVAAYKQGVRSNPKSASSLTGAAAALFKLGKFDDARAHAELAIDVAPPAAHDILARIAVAAGDPATARREAQLAQAADPSLPTSNLIEGMILHKEGRYAAALPYFLKARDALAARTVQMTDVHYYIGDSLARLERYPEAEQAFVAELKVFPNNLRARAGLAMLYRATGRDRESEEAIAALVRNSPSAEAYDLAAQLWTMFGEPQRAAAARAEANRQKK